MMKIITKLIAATMFAGWMGAAQASLIFNFEFFDVDSATNVSGTITNLLDNTLNQTNAVVSLLNAGSSGAVTGIYSHQDDNMFDVTGGVLTLSLSGSNQHHYANPALIGGAALRWFYTFPSTDSEANLQVVGRSNTNSVSPVMFTLVAVPEPDAVTILLLGIAGLGFHRYRRQR